MRQTQQCAILITMLLVVFGAGASYDSLAAYPKPSPGMTDRPPLANELFDNRPLFAQALSRLPACHPIITYLRSVPELPRVNVEQVLDGLMSEASEYPERFRQLAAIRFYLREALTTCSSDWLDRAQGVTNYKTLLDQIRRNKKSDESVCFVTFNYDTLFEDALRSIGVRLESIGDYIADQQFSLIKIHGSVDWWRAITSSLNVPKNGDGWAVVNEVVAHADEITVSDAYSRDTARPMAGWPQGAPMFPAIAIPLERKRDFECPREHLEALDAVLRVVRKVLIIGWRATDLPFVALLKERLAPGTVETYVVSGSQAETREVVDRLNDCGLPAGHFFAGTGFTDFVVRRAGDEFLRA